MQLLWLRYYCIFTEGSFGIKRFHKTNNSELHYRCQRHGMVLAQLAYRKLI